MLPRSVNIFGERWKVVVKKDIGENCLGLCSYSEKTLYIKKQSEQDMLQTYLHELFHAMCGRTSMHQAPDWHLSLEEIVADKFATVLVENGVTFKKTKKR